MRPNASLITFGFATQLRQTELLGLRWRDADLDMLSIPVTQVLYKRRGTSKRAME